MENKITPELIEKAKQAKTPEELIDIAKINNVELTAEEAKTYFGQLNKTGELNDEDLDNVSGGGCYAKDGYLLTTIGYGCDYYEGTDRAGVDGTCCKCKYWDVKNLTGYVAVGAQLRCLNPNNKKG